MTDCVQGTVKEVHNNYMVITIGSGTEAKDKTATIPEDLAVDTEKFEVGDDVTCHVDGSGAYNVAKAVEVE